MHLCNEDSASSKYDGLESVLQDQCEFNCSDTALAAEFSTTEWNCTFVSTCRRVFEHDTCGTDAHYTCGD
ncbi:MAG: hypothetical protein JNL83_35805 [Myxococcales bacterium]|nr:hypothetical protein [Myxococcales bacterium]